MRLIDADAISYESIDTFDAGRHEHYYGTGIIAVRKEDIDAMPTIQPDIVRCEYCKHFESEYGYCDYYQWNMTGGDFCSKAENVSIS